MSFVDKEYLHIGGALDLEITIAISLNYGFCACCNQHLLLKPPRHVQRAHYGLGLALARPCRRCLFRRSFSSRMRGLKPFKASVRLDKCLDNNTPPVCPCPRHGPEVMSNLPA